ncbi:MAG: hypothetical protein CMK00_02015 [Planctomycetes bacterium]|jgi:tRNA modification GTPase|nr:hypothetical protein [Planctomycetota bacterium]HJO26188.1 GTPase [Planctomycetota bacterium]
MGGVVGESAGTTIAAIATAAGSGARGVLRLSGPRCRKILGELWVGQAPALAERAMLRGRVNDGRGEQPLLLLWMPAPASYTREDVAELHTPGSPPLLKALYERLLELGAEAAGPGEFTRRAFLNGRLDLTRAEGVLSLVEARTDDQRRAATALLSGGLERLLSVPLEGLEELRALAEAGLDFAPEDTGHVERREQLARGRELLGELDLALAWETARVAPVGLPRVALYGAPSAGKSALFNALVKEGPGGPALVHAAPGTTRDHLRGRWQLPGAAGEVELLDTPGRAADTACEAGAEAGDEAGHGDGAGAARLAQQAAREIWSGADLILWVIDPAAPEPDTPQAPPGTAPHILVWSKCERREPVPPHLPSSASAIPDARRGPAVETSALSGLGLAELARSASAALARPIPAGTDPGSGSTERASGLLRELSAHHRRALLDARGELSEALNGLEAGGEEDIFAEGLRQASARLGRITGATAPEELLSHIFARFCIGK